MHHMMLSSPTVAAKCMTCIVSPYALAWADVSMPAVSVGNALLIAAWCNLVAVTKL